MACSKLWQFATQTLCHLSTQKCHLFNLPLFKKFLTTDMFPANTQGFIDIVDWPCFTGYQCLCLHIHMHKYMHMHIHIHIHMWVKCIFQWSQRHWARSRWILPPYLKHSSAIKSMGWVHTLYSMQCAQAFIVLWMTPWHENGFHSTGHLWGESSNFLTEVQ